MLNFDYSVQKLTICSSMYIITVEEHPQQYTTISGEIR